MLLFNSFIGDLQLREIFISGVKFTWSNKQNNPTLIKLDRILVSSCWDTHYHAAHAWSKARVGSDHSPIILDT
jgi:endonuclease/exonuclease/phosphatase family metal-dependent hydrolase